MKGIVSFYEKPGCTRNALQKEQLRAAGYVIQALSLIDKNWDPQSLYRFFGGNSPHDCVNTRAPQITSGALAPSTLTEDELLEQMRAHPILIKRPLIFYRGEYCCGFDTALVAKLLGAKQTDPGCAHPTGGHCS
ncbi:ArsC/Spx/MgsR family protein [Coraliomargarita akajimensis]|uniref:Arsenate reductase-related protein n=1 Tax=Coraliomargarita akajimensis (strain DSM 45221 / IAM 15411 / JCM 23193 / KCTC 12865 / 04OKA010-24) TaxID=583355 RepID=D5EPB2_CORAD|nr:ArsC/Spx/MgsR family protein [Coraliomargarita akajimensis]ADE55622.1 arsenate reductase-related protein [Coraliomargarita akajimensis DSM 45221]